MPQRRGRSRGYWGLTGDTKMYTSRSTRGLLDNKVVVLTRIRAEAPPLTYTFGEGVGRLCSPIPVENPSPPGRPLPTHITPFDLDDETPTKGEIEAAVRRLRRNRAGGHTHLREEHLQQWIRNAHEAYIYTVPLNLTRWIKLVEIIQFMWYIGSIPTELGWAVLVLVPKGNTYTWGSGY